MDYSVADMAQGRLDAITAAHMKPINWQTWHAWPMADGIVMFVYVYSSTRLSSMSRSMSLYFQILA